MTIEEAKIELDLLRGWSNTASAEFSQRVRALYSAVTGKELRKCRCKDILTDALAEIYSKLYPIKFKKNMEKGDARLVRGVVLQIDGNHYTNANITDEVAREFLKRFPQRKDWFEVLPSATTEKEVVAEVAETPKKDDNVPSKGAKSSTKATTPKKKKTAQKRK